MQDDAKNRVRGAAAEPGDVADFIIIGGGSAGAVLAARLSEDPANRVVLIEAGPKNDDLLVRMPAGAGTLFKKKGPKNWGLETTPQKHLNGRALYWPRGRGLGGSSAINGQIYIRGHARDYDQWRQSGLNGWSYAETLPYFKRAERFEAGADDYHGGDGPLGIEWGKAPASRRAFYEAFVAAGAAAGFPRTADFNGAQQAGMGFYQLTIADGERQSASRAYLGPDIRARANLSIRTGAHVARIELRRGRAVGVSYYRNGRGGLTTLNARREILLCAGAVHSPAILQRSGIGDPDDLAAAGVALAHPLPGVGRNLQDHLDAALAVETAARATAYSVNKGWKKLAIGLDYLIRKAGPGRENFLEAGAFLFSRPGLDRPDLQFHFVAGIVVDHLRTTIDKDGFTLHVCQLRPESRGAVRIASPDPFADPLIDPNYFESAEDRRALREGVKIGRRILSHPPMADWIVGEILPGPDIRSDDEIDAFLRARAETIYHPVGTCKMGAGHDAMAVTDDELRVRGLAGLRVVDASVMPLLVSGNTNAPTIMIAEKAADLILGRPPLAPAPERLSERPVPWADGFGAF